MPELDACGDINIPEKHTADDDIDALVLYADVDWTDPEAVAKRKAEWEELFA